VHLTCAAIAAVLATACASPGSRIDAVPELRPGILAGYLTRESLPDSMALVPAPPAMGSDAFALDEAVARAAATTRGSARWTLAIDDANLAFPRAAGVFECALDAPVSAQDTPRLYVLLRRAGGRGSLHLRSQGSLPTRAAVHGQPAADLHAR
jgi:acid phosphatase (class A)